MVIRGTKILNNNQNMSSYIQLFKSLSATLVQAYLPKCINTRNYQVDKQRSKVFRSTVAQMPQVERRVCFSSFPVHFQNRGVRAFWPRLVRPSTGGRGHGRSLVASCEPKCGHLWTVFPSQKDTWPIRMLLELLHPGLDVDRFPYGSARITTHPTTNHCYTPTNLRVLSFEDVWTIPVLDEHRIWALDRSIWQEQFESF